MNHINGICVPNGRPLELPLTSFTIVVQKVTDVLLTYDNDNNHRPPFLIGLFTMAVPFVLSSNTEAYNFKRAIQLFNLCIIHGAIIRHLETFLVWLIKNS